MPQAKSNFWLEIALKNENRDKAIQALDGIIKELQTSRISEGELNKLKMLFLVTKRKSLSDDAPAGMEEHPHHPLAERREFWKISTTTATV